MNAFRVRPDARQAWIAIFAFLLQALLPAVINAAQRPNIHVAEICTAFGIKKIATPDSSSSDASPSYGQCPICSLADLTSLPPPPMAFGRQMTGAVAFAIRLADTPIPHLVWPRAYPRGPPVPVLL
jgi:hypothetical protein